MRDWVCNSSYALGDLVIHNEEIYVCMSFHCSDYLTVPSQIEEVYWQPFYRILSYYITFCYDDPARKNLKWWSPSPVENLPQPIAPKPPTYNLPQPIDFNPMSQNINQSTINLPIKPTRSKSLQSSSKENIDSIEFENNVKELLDIEYRLNKIRNVNSSKDVRNNILRLNVDDPTKLFILNKYESFSNSNQQSSDYIKGMAWVETVLRLPFGIYKDLPVSIEDPSDEICDFFEYVKSNLDESIYGMESVKNEILEFLARKIANPYGKGDVIALCGPAGCGKTKLLTSLANSLSLPFQQINCGGLNDVSMMTGHSETYIGSKPGKIVEALQASGCMNPIIYLDEIDKISEMKSQEINGVLTHLLDEQQNSHFQDNFLGGVDLNLGNVLFVVAFNDITKIDKIVLDRMKVIHLKGSSEKDKIQITKKILIPEVLDNINPNLKVDFTPEAIKMIINFSQQNIYSSEMSTGIRRLKKIIETLINKVNLLTVSGKIKRDFLICEKFVKDNSQSFDCKEDLRHIHMYN